MSFWASALLFASTLGLLGEADPEISLRVDASRACLPAEDLRRDLELELSPYRFALSTDQDATLSVTVRSKGSAWTVTIRLDRDRAEPFVRELAARDCDEVRLAARFVVAVALGRAPGRPMSEESNNNWTGTSTAALAEPTAATSPSAASAASTSSEPIPLLTPETAKATPRRARLREPAEQEADTWLSGRALIASGPAPNPLFGGGIGAGWGSRRTGAWSPALELELSYTAAFPTRTELGAANFEWGAVGVLACPSLFEAGPIRVRPCALGHLGFLRASGSETYEPETSTRPWVDVGVRLGLLIPVGSRVEIPVAGEMSYAFSRDSFSFDSEVFHEVPPLFAGGSVGVMVHLW